MQDKEERGIDVVDVQQYRRGNILCSRWSVLYGHAGDHLAMVRFLKLHTEMVNRVNKWYIKITPCPYLLVKSPVLVVPQLSTPARLSHHSRSQEDEFYIITFRSLFHTCLFKVSDKVSLVELLDLFSL